MNAPKPFVFIHPDTGLETVERRGEPARLLHFMRSQDGQWMEVFNLNMALHTTKTSARMHDIGETHGPNLIHQREGRKGLAGRRLKEYRINPGVQVVEQ